MQTVKLLIPGTYWDSCIYKGCLHLFGSEGDIRFINWYSLIDKWDIREDLRPALTLAFLHSDFFYKGGIKVLLQDIEIRTIVARKLKNLVKEKLQVEPCLLKNYTIRHQDNPCPFPHADAEIYGDKLYVGGPFGLVRTTLDKQIESNHTQKIWDAHVLGMSASSVYSSLALAAGEKGLFELGINANRTTSDEPRSLYPGPCRDCNWVRDGIFASSDESGFLAVYPKWNNSINRSMDSQLEEVIKAEDIFGSSGYSWGFQDTLYQAIENGIKIVDYQPSDPKGVRNCIEPPGTVPIHLGEGNVVSASAATFGTIIELEDEMIIYTKAGDIITFPEEPVNWRIFPRSKNYKNQLHIIYEDRLEVISFLDD